ncbi:hypothetical protein [Streptomyces rimosus]|uniref:hypothetical protein n=1 Tax=Streptomyces rimosus TaxID=1927 RepID=UPI0004CBBA47|nr:hypothetical protein [Streptomyces rimosus]
MFRQPYLALTSAVADAPKAAVDSIAALITALKADADAVQFPGAATTTDTVAADAAVPAAAAAGTAVPAADGARS